jgi:hypothetical protein
MSLDMQRLNRVAYSKVMRDGNGDQPRQAMIFWTTTHKWIKRYRERGSKK